MDKISMLLIVAGVVFGIIGKIINPHHKLDIKKISKCNFIIPMIGVICVSIGLLIRVFLQYG